MYIHNQKAKLINNKISLRRGRSSPRQLERAAQGAHGVDEVKRRTRARPMGIKGQADTGQQFSLLAFFCLGIWWKCPNRKQQTQEDEKMRKDMITVKNFFHNSEINLIVKTSQNGLMYIKPF